MSLALFISLSQHAQGSDSEDEPTTTTLPPLFMESTTSHGLFEQLLATYYIPMEIWYTRTVIDKVSEPKELC